MNTFFLSLGSNIEPEKNIPRTLKILGGKFRLEKISSIYETDPVGPSGKRKFWNLAVRIETPLGKERLSKELQRIETELGRRRDPHNKFAPRTIDVDILPQPGYQTCPFVMTPLAEIAPKERDGESGTTFGELAQELQAAPSRPRKIDFSLDLLNEE